MYKSQICVLLIFIVNLESIVALVQDFFWRDYIPDYIPHDALEAAKGRYIGQTSEGGTTPGTIYPYKNLLILEEHGRKIHKVNIKILCTNYPERFYWEKINLNSPIGNQMDNAVKGGYNVGISDYLYIGKTFLDGEWKVGKVTPPPFSFKGLYVWTSDGKHYKVMEFQLLKYNYTIVAEDGSVLFKI